MVPLHKSKSFFSLVPLLIATLATPGHPLDVGSQLGGGSGGGGHPIGVTIQGPDRPGLFGHTCSGDFDGDMLADVALIRGGILEYVIAPGAYGSWLWSTREVNDLVTLPRTSSQATGTADTLVAIGPDGLTWHGDISTGDMAGIVIASGPGWNDGTIVDAADAGDLGGPRIVAVLDDMRSLRQLRDDSTGYIEEDIPLYPPLSSDALDIALVDFDGGAPEIAIVTQDSLLVYSLGGSLLSFLSFPGYTTTAFCAGKQSDGSGWIAWSSLSPTGLDLLLLEDGSGQRPLTVLGSSLGVTGMQALQWDGDANDDLVLHVAGLAQLWTLVNQGGPQARFGSSAAGAGVISYPGGSQEQALPCAVDIDLDGDVDIQLPIQATGALGVEKNTRIDETTLMAAIGSSLDSLINPSLVVKAPGSTSTTLSMGFSLTLPANLQGATHLELSVWGKPDSTSYLNPQAVWSNEWDLANTQSGARIALELPNPDLLQPNPPDNSTAQVEFSNLYFFEMRLVDRNTVPSTLVLPPQIYGIETESYSVPCQCTNQAYLAGLKRPGSNDIIVETPYGHADPEYVGLINQVPMLPDPLPGVQIVK